MKPERNTLVPRSRRETITAYNKLSGWYDWLSGSSEYPLVQMGLCKLSPRLGDSVLEIGFGTGGAILELAGMVGDSGRVIGVDISQGMLDVARKKIDCSDFCDRIELKIADAISLPFENNTFNAIFCSFTLELFENHEIIMVLNECQRVLKPGGKLGIVSMAKSDHENLVQLVYEWLHSHLPSYFDCRPIDIQNVLVRARFQILELLPKNVWGLPVEICVAKKME